MWIGSHQAVAGLTTFRLARSTARSTAARLHQLRCLPGGCRYQPSHQRGDAAHLLRRVGGQQRRRGGGRDRQPQARCEQRELPAIAEAVGDGLAAHLPREPQVAVTRIRDRRKLPGYGPLTGRAAVDPCSRNDRPAPPQTALGRRPGDLRRVTGPQREPGIGQRLALTVAPPGIPLDAQRPEQSRAAMAARSWPSARARMGDSSPTAASLYVHPDDAACTGRMPSASATGSGDSITAEFSMPCGRPVRPCRICSSVRFANGVPIARRWLVPVRPRHPRSKMRRFKVWWGRHGGVPSRLP